MIFNNQELNTQITVIEREQGGFLYDLVELATNLQYQKVDRAIQTFLANNPEVEIRDPGVPGPLLVEEWVLYLFLMESKAERAKPFKLWVSKEVLPTVHAVGLRAIKKLQVQNLLHQDQSIPRERLIEICKDAEIVDEVINSWQCYRSLGFRPLSDFGVRPAKFYSWACQEGVFDAETGEPCEEYESLMYSCDKYSNSFLVGGVWYAFKEELVDEFLSYKPTEPTVELVLPKDFEVTDLFSTPAIKEPRNVCTLMELRL